jgi:hypothetical protein
MKLPRRFLLSLVALAIATGAALLFARQRSVEQVTHLFGGPAGLAPVISAQQVLAFRLARPAARDASESPAPEFGGAQTTSDAVSVAADDARQLALILRDPATYTWDSAKSCKFDPGVGLRFVGKDSTTEVVFCFHCDEVQIYHDGQRAGGEDIDNARSRLAAIMKRIFPRDEEIQKL